MLVQEYLKNKKYFRSKDIKPKNDMMYQDIYIIAYVKIQKMKVYYPLCQTYSPTVV